MKAVAPVLIAGSTLLLAAGAGAQTTDEAARTAFTEDVHAESGLTCVACHTGDTPPVALERTAIAPLCAGCHSDAAYMRQFDPQVRVDQYAQYQTSVHGQQMAKGEERVATCSDCHGAHGIRRVTDSRSSVSPLNVAVTCARCHADQTRMAAFNIQATEVADWSESVHAAALLQRGDTAAPTCVSCHGSHGAVPPGVTSVTNVCSQCHVREAELFRAGPKKAIFDDLGLPECLVCHENHRIVHPTDALVGIDQDAVCALCHDDSTNGSETIASFRRQLDELSMAIDDADRTLTDAERAGMLVDDGRTAMRDAHEHLINARVLVHSFAPSPFDMVAGDGITAARRASTDGEQALVELRDRHRGLGIATIFVLGLLITLWLKIRSLPETS